MEGLIVVISIVIAVVNAVNKEKKVRKNAPGQAARPRKTTARFEPLSNEQNADVRSQSTAPSPAQSAEFWTQIVETLDHEEKEQATATRGHEAAAQMAEGESRECEHGSIGGSMAYDTHEGESVVEKRENAALPEDRLAEKQLTAKPSAGRLPLSAQELRSAVVMAEILKRPQERMMEQARRWTVR